MCLGLLTRKRFRLGENAVVVYQLVALHTLQNVVELARSFDKLFVVVDRVVLVPYNLGSSARVVVAL